MSTDINSDSPEQVGYEVRVKGCLNDEFLTWLDWPGVRDTAVNETILAITTTDQAALYGIINRLRDLGLTLIAVTPVDKSNKE